MYKTCERSVAYNKVVRTFLSCKTKEHLEVSCALADNYLAHYSDNPSVDCEKFKELYSLQYINLGFHLTEPLDEVYV